MSSKKLTPGQTLWWVPRNNRYREPFEVTVTKVGRKWIHLDNHHRIDAETLEADGAGYSPPGVCYLSQGAYESETALNQAWRSLQQDLHLLRAPAGITVEKIREARELLGLSDAKKFA